MLFLDWKWTLWLLIAVVLSGCAAQPYQSDIDHLPEVSVGEDNSTETLFRSQTGTFWYGIYLDDVKVGWAKVLKEINPPFVSFQKSFRIQKQQEFELLINGYTHHLANRLDLWFEAKPPFMLERFELFERINDYKVQKKMVRKGQNFQRTIVQDGQRRELPVRQVSFTLKDELALEDWIRKHPKVGDTIYFHFIDNKRLLRDSGVAEIIRMESQRASDRNIKTYEILHTVMAQGKQTSVYRDDLTLLVHKMNSGFELRNESRESAQASIGQVDLYVKFMLPIDKPIGRTNAVKRVRLAVDGRTGAMLAEATGQRIEKDSSGNGFVVTLETNSAHPEAVVPGDVRLYLKIPPALRMQDEPLLKSAKKALDGIEKPEEKISRLLAFVDEVLEDSNEVLSPGLKYLLDRRKGDCSEHAALFEALARSFGIPCRKVSGLVYMGDWSQSFGLHAWNEVILDGYWKPVDPILRNSELPPLYIRFPVDDHKSDKLMRSVQKIKIKIIEVDHFEPK